MALLQAANNGEQWLDFVSLQQTMLGAISCQTTAHQHSSDPQHHGARSCCAANTDEHCFKGQAGPTITAAWLCTEEAAHSKGFPAYLMGPNFVLDLPDISKAVQVSLASVHCATWPTQQKAGVKSK